MKRIFIYLIALLIIYSLIGSYLMFKLTPVSNKTLEIVIYCGLCGGIGGVTYCLRAIYLNACVLKNWDSLWLPWYFIRPLVSLICGVVSFLFLKTSLILLEAKQLDATSNFAFYALAFIAGLNVDKFIGKIEDIAETTWGIKKSRVNNSD